jgi:hypothetical protein
MVHLFNWGLEICGLGIGLFGGQTKKKKTLLPIADVN